MTTLLAHTRERYLRTPRLQPRDDGGADLAVVVWEPGKGESIAVIPLDAAGTVSGPERVEWTGERVVTLTPGTWPPLPSENVRDEDRTRDGEHEVWIERDARTSRVLYRREGGRDVELAETKAFAPAVCATVKGTVIAFHRPLLEENVVKWIDVLLVDPAGDRVDLALPVGPESSGEQQGYEFPTLVAIDDGFVLFGRGSHRFWWQAHRNGQWSERTAMPGDDGAWGCRGRRVAAVRLTNGSILTARREKQGIVVAALPPSLFPSATPHRSAPLSSTVPLPRGEGPRSQSRRSDGVRSLPDGRVRALPDGRVRLFGDLHQHSAHSDGCGTADEPFLRARDHYQDDFCALSDHESFIGKRIGPGEWAYLSRVTDSHDAPGTFATIHAYEWTAKMYPGPGHKVVYLPRGDLPIVSRDDVPEGVDLLAMVRAQGGFAVPHHVGWTGGDLSAHDELGQPVWEICSCHGCYEHAAHPLGQRGELHDQLVDAALARGLRFGFIACSDGHGLLFHHGVARKRDPFRTGLTAVHADACTREAILDAIRARRCYATSGAKIALDVRDADTGASLLGAFVDGPVRALITATGTTRLKRLVVVGELGKILESVESHGETSEIITEISGPYSYARVEQEDGEMAWASPTFVTPRAAAVGSAGAPAG